MVFNRNHRRTEPNLIRARKILRESYLSRHGGSNDGEELANIYFDQAMKTRPDEAWEALLKEVLKGDSVEESSSLVSSLVKKKENSSSRFVERYAL